MDKIKKHIKNIEWNIVVLDILIVVVAITTLGVCVETERLNSKRLEQYLELQQRVRNLEDDFTDLNFYMEGLEKELHLHDHYIDEMSREVFKGA